MAMPKFTAEQSLKSSHQYWAVATHRAGAMSGSIVQPAQLGCSPPCSDFPGAWQRCCFGFPGSRQFCWTQPAPPCSPCGQLTGCARQQCECTISGGHFIRFPFGGDCGVCIGPAI